MPTSSISGQLADFVFRLSYDELPDNLRQKIKTYLLDWLGSAYAGKTQQPPGMMLEVVRELGGKPESTIILDGSKTMCLLAALVNGASSHVVEMDDLHRESIFHPAAAIMPAVFALAERERASGRDLMEGWEGRAGGAERPSREQRRGWTVLQTYFYAQRV